ncbi:MAG: translation elongation factor Ts [Gemmataceae bacterium]
MAAISAESVKALRDKTNAPMMDCKAALIKADGDMEKAIQILREENKAIQTKKGDREAAEGRIAAFIDDAKQVGAVIEVRCESAPVAKSEQFTALCAQLAKQVALENPKNVEELLAQKFVDDKSKTVNDLVGDVIGLIRENMKPARFIRLTGGHMGAYIHHTGDVGVMLQVEGEKNNADILRDVCLHITACNPVAATRDDVDAAVVEKEKEIARTQAASTGKPANIVEKIVEGKMKTWFGENVLLEQPFVKDDKKTVGDLLKGAGLKLVKYVRLKVGEK